MKKFFVTGFLEQLDNDGLLTPAAEDKIRSQYKGLQLSTTDGDRMTIGYPNDCVARLKWDNGFYNDNLIGSRKYATGKELMREYLKAWG